MFSCQNINSFFCPLGSAKHCITKEFFEYSSIKRFSDTLFCLCLVPAIKPAFRQLDASQTNQPSSLSLQLIRGTHALYICASHVNNFVSSCQLTLYVFFIPDLCDLIRFTGMCSRKSQCSGLSNIL